MEISLKTISFPRSLTVIFFSAAEPNMKGVSSLSMQAKKALGQHFLIQESIAERIAASLKTDGCRSVVEIGPGKGILTKYLLQQPLPVFAIELDRDLIPILEKTFSHSSLHIIQGDVLRVNLLEHL